MKPLMLDYRKIKDSYSFQEDGIFLLFDIQTKKEKVSLRGVKPPPLFPHHFLLIEGKVGEESWGQEHPAIHQVFNQLFPYQMEWGNFDAHYPAYLGIGRYPERGWDYILYNPNIELEPVVTEVWETRSQPHILFFKQKEEFYWCRLWKHHKNYEERLQESQRKLDELKHPVVESLSLHMARDLYPQFCYQGAKNSSF